MVSLIAPQEVMDSGKGQAGMRIRLRRCITRLYFTLLSFCTEPHWWKGKGKGKGKGRSTRAILLVLGQKACALKDSDLSTGRLEAAFPHHSTRRFYAVQCCALPAGLSLRHWWEELKCAGTPCRLAHGREHISLRPRATGCKRPPGGSWQ